MPDNVHLRDTITVIREEGGTQFGVSALGPVEVSSGGGITPTDISNLYPEVDLTPAVEAVGCFNSRWGDCNGKVANCPTLGTVVLCGHHHKKAHGRNYPIERGSFKCWPLTTETP